jgi:hypothetical protein
MFAAGNESARASFMQEGAGVLVLKLMRTFPNDIYVQWQGCQCIGALSATPKLAAEFGANGLDAVVNSLSRTDVKEFGFTGIWALQNLLTNSASNMQIARADSGEEFLMRLKGEFADYPQLCYSIDKLVSIVRSSSTRKESIERIASPILNSRSLSPIADSRQESKEGGGEYKSEAK